MTIETKYNIGDKVWFTTLNRNQRAKVGAFTIVAFGDGSIQIEYSINKNGFCWSRLEHDLFPSKEELLKSL